MSGQETIFDIENRVMKDIDKNNKKAIADVCSVNHSKKYKSTERIIGDLHFFGKDMINTVPRDFASVEEMNAFMIREWNTVTEKEDTVFVDGDFFDGQYCTKEEVFEILNQLNGRIILIAGNHDIPYLDWYREYGMDVIEYPILKDGFWIISHEPQYVSLAAPYANIFAHVHLNPMYRDVSPRSFCVSAERIGYRPIPLGAIKTAVKACAKENMC